jgi:molybdenum cofactor cytidylyltransferase
MTQPRRIGLLLAAGRGRRFDASGARNKLLQKLDGVPVAHRSARALAAGCDEIWAVVGPHAPAELRATLQQAGARLIVCENADLGMGHSLACGAQAMLDANVDANAADAVLVMPADMPWMQARSVRAVSDAWLHLPASAQPEAIVLAMTPDGQRGHPVAFGRAHLPALSRLSGDQGARDLLRQHPLIRIILDDAGIVRDVDAPHDLSP